MGERMRAFPWAETSLGPPQQWPRSLKTAVGIMLNSRQPFWIGWGPELAFLYNDPYLSIIGGKHPQALGQPTAVVWREIWSDIGPMLSTALGGDQGTYVESQLLIMERSGYPEETYYTFSYSPIPDDTGGVGGIICANTDDTQRVIGERRLALLRELAAATGDVRTQLEACTRSAKTLGSNPRDLPFALIYLAAPEGDRLSLCAANGIEPGHPAGAERVYLDQPSRWPLAEVLHSGRPAVVTGLHRLFEHTLPSGPWPRGPDAAAVMPIPSTGESGVAGIVILGLNPYQPFDDNYRDFLHLVTSQIAAAISNAQAYEQERMRAEALAELDRAKTAFFSNVSHEFRTPLTLMLGPIEDMLARSAAALPGETRAQLELVNRNGLRLLRLVNTLLDFSRIEAGRVRAVYRPTDLAAYTAELAGVFRSTIERAGLRLAVSTPPLAEPVYLDREMWEKIVLNLLSNAFKFTLEGEIAVSVRQQGRMAELRVRDTGAGIPPEEMPRLFERFHRVESTRGRTHEGSGIGLALVQELIRLHGGEASAESVLGQGTTFTIRLPVGTAHLPADRLGEGTESGATAAVAAPFVEEALRWLPEGAPASPPLEPSNESDTRARILVADDNVDMRAYVSRLLAEHYRVEVAADGMAALESAVRSPPDLILTDVMMPRLDGVGLLKRIRANPRTAGTPVILLSARAGEESRVEGLETGADDYLIKPFSARELLARVNSHLQMMQMRRDAADALRRSEARFRALADSAPAMLWVTEPDGLCSFLSRGWYEFTGQSPEQGLGWGWLDAVHPEDRDTTRDVILRANAGKEPVAVDYRLRRWDGMYRWVVDAARPRFGPGGEYLGFTGSVIDIHDRKRVEEQLRQAAKMEAIGRLAGGLAHDFNNQLQAVAGFARFVEADAGLSQDARVDLQEIKKSAERMASLTRQLLAFSRQQVLMPETLELAAAVADAQPLLQRLIGPAVEFVTESAPEPVWVRVDRTQLVQILMNLAINARDAMPHGGRLYLDVAQVHLPKAEREDGGAIPAGDYGRLIVRDTGTGISPEHLAHIFEPFFTTKGVGQGTGLGLATVHGIVAQSQGHVGVESSSSGTEFTLLFPIADPPIAERASDGEGVSGEDPRPEQPLRILVVDDEAGVRQILARVLAEAGHDVLTAHGAREALAVVEHARGEIDLVLSDLVMPGMSGAELGDFLTAKYPEISLAWMSGYPMDEAIRQGKRPSQAFLQKPVEHTHLLGLVRTVARLRSGLRSGG